jgi:hypothetical protein
MYIIDLLTSVFGIDPIILRSLAALSLYLMGLPEGHRVPPRAGKETEVRKKEGM